MPLEATYVGAMVPEALVYYNFSVFFFSLAQRKLFPLIILNLLAGKRKTKMVEDRR